MQFYWSDVKSVRKSRSGWQTELRDALKAFRVWLTFVWAELNSYVTSNKLELFIPPVIGINRCGAREMVFERKRIFMRNLQENHNLRNRGKNFHRNEGRQLLWTIQDLFESQVENDKMKVSFQTSCLPFSQQRLRCFPSKQNSNDSRLSSKIAPASSSPSNFCQFNLNQRNVAVHFHFT